MSSIDSTSSGSKISFSGAQSDMPGKKSRQGSTVILFMDKIINQVLYSVNMYYFICLFSACCCFHLFPFNQELGSPKQVVISNSCYNHI